MEACFSVPALALLATIGTVIGTVIGTLFWQLIKSKDAQIADLKLMATRGTDLAEFFAKKAVKA